MIINSMARFRCALVHQKTPKGEPLVDFIQQILGWIVHNDIGGLAEREDNAFGSGTGRSFGH